MVLHVAQGKGARDRYVMLSPTLLQQLRAWWRVERPARWLFPGRNPEQPMQKGTVQWGCRLARYRSRLGKPVTPPCSPVYSAASFLRYLEEAFDSGRLRSGGALSALTERRTFLAHLAPARKTEWVVYAKPPFGGPQQVLDYVGRYTHRVAISDDRLVALEAGHVRFRYRNSRAQPPSVATATLSASEFIRRFLLHVLPTGFHRIRHYGLFGNRHRTAKLARCRQLLGMSPPRPTAAPSDYRDRHEALSAESLRTCPSCGDGHMTVVEAVRRAYTRPALIDTS